MNDYSYFLCCGGAWYSARTAQNKHSLTLAVEHGTVHNTTFLLRCWKQTPPCLQLAKDMAQSTCRTDHRYGTLHMVHGHPRLNTDNRTPLPNRSHRHQPMGPLRPNGHVNTPHDRMRRKERYVEMDSSPLGVYTPYWCTPYSRRLASSPPFPYMAPAGTPGHFMDLDAFHLLSYATSQEAHPTGLCWLLARRALESASYATAPKTGRELLERVITGPTARLSFTTNNVPPPNRLDKDPLIFPEDHNVHVMGLRQCTVALGRTTQNTARYSWHTPENYVLSPCPWTTNKD